MNDTYKRTWNRRAVIGGTLAVAAGAAILALRKGDRGGPHDAYFSQLSAALTDARVGHPVLVIDRKRLHANIEAVRSTLAPSKLDVRIVVKSLPVPGLLDAVSTALRTDRCMVFNGAMILDTLKWKPTADLLLGKPLPATEVASVLDRALPLLAGRPGPQWLADSVPRLQAYAAVARSRNTRLRINLEIDVGLHRGGLRGTAALAAALDAIAELPELEFAGLMGYDPHVPKMPRPATAYADAIAHYSAAREVVRGRVSSDAFERLTFNAAGSPTYRMHANDHSATELSIGSGFVKPRDFDLPTLDHHVPAVFIAAPVLKTVEPLQIPGLEALAGALAFMDANAQRGFFIYGGHWLAEPVSPPGVEYNSLYGRSSNQELLTGSGRVPLRPDDYVFLRPNQSEALLLQFGDILVFDEGKIADTWPTFPVSA